MEELETLIAEYNAIEAAQIERLRVIFETVRNRRHYRAVRFGTSAAGANVWTNCWDVPLEMGITRNVDLLERQITELIPGE